MISQMRNRDAARRLTLNWAAPNVRAACGNAGSGAGSA
jgi:hypothetical protein